MPLSFFLRKLGVPNYQQGQLAGQDQALFLFLLLGVPNYVLSALRFHASTQPSRGFLRWTATVPNGSSFPPVVSEATGWLSPSHIYGGSTTTFTEGLCIVR